MPKPSPPPSPAPPPPFPPPPLRQRRDLAPILRIQQHWRPLMVNVHHESAHTMNWAMLYFFVVR